MTKVTAKWFRTACQTVEDKRMSMFFEIMYLVIKSLWILFGDCDNFYLENITQYILDMQKSKWKIERQK